MDGAPLDGLTVVDLTHVLAGPYAALTLGELGARIIKVERPGEGDDSRAFPPFAEDGSSAYFATINRGKHSIALDLTDAGDLDLLHRMLAKADVVLENYRPGTMERFGLGWDQIQTRHPHLVYGAVSGYGHTGPWAGKPAYDMVVQALGGVMSITGEKGRDPVRCGASIGDIVAGMFLVQGVLAALWDRERTGRGRKVDVGMLDSQLAIIEHAIAITDVTGTPPGPTGARHQSLAPFETYRARDGLIVIAAGNNKLFAAAAHVLGLDDMPLDARFATNAARVENVSMLKRRFETVLLDQPVDHWIALLEAAGVPCGPIANVAQTMAHPQIRARNMLVDVEAEPGGRAFKAAGNPIKISGAPDPDTRPPAPSLDANRAEVLAWLQMMEKTAGHGQ